MKIFNLSHSDFLRAPLLWSLGVSFAVLLMLCSSAAALTVELQPKDISIGIGYHGEDLSVSGQHQPGEDIIIKISAAAEEETLKYKGKAGGVFWMKMGDIVYKPVPKVYMVYSSKSLDQLLPNEILSQKELGYEALAAHVDIESAQDGLDKEFWMQEFIKFKEHENLYYIDVPSNQQSAGNKADQYQFTIDWPYQAPPGEYKLEVFAVNNQRIVGYEQTEFQIQSSGIVAFMSNLAFNRAALYGLVAILVASLAGFAVGLAFKGGGAH